MISAMAVSEQSNSAEGPFRARCQSSQSANQGVFFFFPAWQRNNCVGENCYQSFFLLRGKQLHFLQMCQTEARAASLSPQLFVIKYRPLWPIDEAHLEVPDDTSHVMAAREQLQENCREIKHLVFLEVTFL